MDRLDRCLAVVSAGVALASLLPLLADVWWGFELFSHFRIQYLSLLAILVVLQTWRCRWRWAVALVPVALVSANAVYSSWPVAETADNARPQFVITIVNVQAENAVVAPLVERVQRDTPDLLLVVEYNETWRQGLQPLDQLYPYRIEAPRADRFGMALLSRYPISEPETFDLLTTTAISTRVDLAGQNIRFLGVHLRPPVSSAWAATRDQQLDELSNLLVHPSEPTVIAGDFNVTTYSPVFAEWLETNRLRSATQASGLTFSWPTFLPLLGVLIDHCVVSDDFIINGAERGTAFGSDHYPMTATLSLRGA
jgi:endonuclease/exonuclease/phosphatase (EEP) superfamily protein YafD